MKQGQCQHIEFFMMHHDELFNYLNVRLGSSQFAMEMLQETYLQIIRKAEYFEKQTMTLALLKKVSLNLAIDNYRKQQIFNDHIEFDNEQLENVFSSDVEGWTETELAVAKHQFEQQILKKIAELPAACQDVFILAHVHHLTQDEIVEALDLSRSMVTKHLSRAYSYFIPLLFPINDLD